jgi:hypothetical protein
LGLNFEVNDSMEVLKNGGHVFMHRSARPINQGPKKDSISVFSRAKFNYKNHVSTRINKSLEKGFLNLGDPLVKIREMRSKSFEATNLSMSF